MALEIKNYASSRDEVRAIPYTTSVPFHIPLSVCETTLESNDALAINAQTIFKQHVPGYGAMYRLTGDGSHTPSFSATFKKSSSSGDYVNTNGVVNLITFVFDGVDYWYSIVQSA